MERDDPATTILHVIDEEDIDRLYLYRRKRNPTGKAIFGSILNDIISMVNIPTIIVPHN